MALRFNKQGSDNKLPLLSNEQSFEPVTKEVLKDDEGYFLIERFDGKYNVTDSEKNLLLPIWVDEILYTEEHESNILIAPYFERILIFKNDLARVCNNGKMNIVNSKGEFLLDDWYDSISFFPGEGVVLKDDGKYRLLNPKLEPVIDEWLDDITIRQEFDDDAYGLPIIKNMILFGRGYEVILKGEKCFISASNSLPEKVSESNKKQEFDIIGNYHYGYVKVFKENVGWNFVDKKGHLLSKNWFCKVYDFEKDNVAKVLGYDKKNDCYLEHYLGINGKLFNRRPSVEEATKPVIKENRQKKLNKVKM